MFNCAVAEWIFYCKVQTEAGLITIKVKEQSFGYGTIFHKQIELQILWLSLSDLLS